MKLPRIGGWWYVVAIVSAGFLGYGYSPHEASSAPALPVKLAAPERPACTEAVSDPSTHPLYCDPGAWIEIEGSLAYCRCSPKPAPIGPPPPIPQAP